MADFCAMCATDIGIPVSTGAGFCERCTKPLPPDDMWERIWVDPEYSEFRCDKLKPRHNHTLYVRADLYADLKQQRDELLKRLTQAYLDGAKAAEFAYTEHGTFSDVPYNYDQWRALQQSGKVNP